MFLIIFHTDNLEKVIISYNLLIITFNNNLLLYYILILSYLKLVK